jgi:bifunctional UDP-N-acetylglucosamine pyrophosphorylase/glucosamine-1-phosphate N-acetyltransferase
VPADEIYCIVGHEAERVRAAVEAYGRGSLCCRREQLGTGHALQMVKAEFAMRGLWGTVPENLLVLSRAMCR